MDSELKQPQNGTHRIYALSTLAVGQSGRIADLSGNSSFENRLLELGFVPGSVVRVRRSSPLADPVEYEVRHNRICLRRSEAARILVEKVA